jgi:hypothetical protein
MALIFHSCRSCGGKIQIDLLVPAADRRCMLCGQPCSSDGEMELPEEEPSERSREGDHVASTGVRHPVELVETNCPKCRALIAINPLIPEKKQRCHACGMLFKEAPKKARMRKESQMTPDGLLKGRNRERVWMPALGTMLAVVLVAIFGLWMKSRKEPKTAEQGGDVPADARMQIRELIAGFTAAKTPEELLSFIRNPEAFREPVQTWSGQHPGSLPIGGQLTNISYLHNVLGARVASVIVVFPSRPEMRFLAAETPSGFRVDWRTFSGIADMSVKEFLEKRPQKPVLLMTIVRRSDYYNNAYSDKKAWMCLQLADADGENTFYAYVPRDHSLKNSFADLPKEGLIAGANPALVSRRMALRLYFTKEGAQSGLQTEVESVVGEGWFVP